MAVSLSFFIPKSSFEESILQLASRISHTLKDTAALAAFICLV